MGAPSPELCNLWLARAFNTQDVEAAAAMYHPDASIVQIDEVHGGTKVARGADGIRRTMAAYIGLKPHMDVITHHTTVAEDFAMTRSQWLIRGVDANGQPTNVDGWIEPGVQKLDGYHALWYARARHGSDDYHRMARQREVQQALLTQFQPATVLTKFQSVESAGAQTVDTDIPQGALTAFVELALKAKDQQVTDLEIVPPTYSNVYPDYTVIHADVAAATAVAPAG